MNPTATKRKLAAILSADAVGYSRLMAQDEAGTSKTINALRDTMGGLIRKHGGRVVDAVGDNLLAEFASVVDAVSSAIALQQELAIRNEVLPAGQRMLFRVGINLGDVMVEGARIVGDGVNIAARVEALAEPGGIAISGTAFDQVEGKLSLRFDSLGEQSLKNIPRPVRVYRVRFEGDKLGSSGSRGKLKGRLGKVASVSGVIALLVATGLWLIWPRPMGWVLDLAGVSGPPVNPPLPDKPSIVVLPFTNMSADPEQEYFSDGITEDLTTGLAGSPLIFVISRNSAFSYKGKSVKVEEIGRQLGVRYVLEGSVRKAADRVRITAQLIDASTGYHLWSKRYDRELSDIFAVQSEIAEEILGALQVEISGAELERIRRKPTQSLTAYDRFSRAAYELNRGPREGLLQARRLLEEAIALDPEFADAFSLLAITYVSEYSNLWDRSPEVLERADELTRRALALNPSNAIGHISLGWVKLFSGQTAAAVKAGERAVELAPSNEWGFALLAMSQAQEGSYVAASQAINRALRLNPRSPYGILAIVAWVNYGAGRTEKAAELFERVRATSPDLIIARVPLAAIYEAEGRHDDSRQMVEEILRASPDLTAQVLVDEMIGLLPFDPERKEKFADDLKKAGLP